MESISERSRRLGLMDKPSEEWMSREDQRDHHSQVANELDRLTAENQAWRQWVEGEADLSMAKTDPDDADSIKQANRKIFHAVTNLTDLGTDIYKQAGFTASKHGLCIEAQLTASRAECEGLREALDHPLLRMVFGYIEDSVLDDDAWNTLKSWFDVRDQALTQPQPQGDEDGK